MKIWKYIEYVLLILSLIIFIIFFYVNPTTTESKMLDGYLGWSYVLLAIACGLALLFPILNAFKSKKGILTLLAIVVGVVLVCGIIYLIAPGSPIEVNKAVDAATLKFTDAALYLTYLFIGAALIAVIWGIVRSSIMKR